MNDGRADSTVCKLFGMPVPPTDGTPLHSYHSVAEELQPQASKVAEVEPAEEILTGEEEIVNDTVVADDSVVEEGDELLAGDEGGDSGEKDKANADKALRHVLQFFLIYFVVLFGLQVVLQLFIVVFQLLDVVFAVNMTTGSVALTLYVGDIFMVLLFAIEIAVQLYIVGCEYWSTWGNRGDAVILVLSASIILYETLEVPADHQCTPEGGNEAPVEPTLELCRGIGRISRLFVFARRLRSLLDTPLSHFGTQDAIDSKFSSLRASQTLALAKDAVWDVSSGTGVQAADPAHNVPPGDE